MADDVPLQVMFVRERLGTELTLEGAFTRVNAHVRPHSTLVPAGVTAKATLKTVLLVGTLLLFLIRQ